MTVSSWDGAGSIILPAAYKFSRFLLARIACAYASARSIGFGVIWVCISSSSQVKIRSSDQISVHDRSLMETQDRAFAGWYGDNINSAAVCFHTTLEGLKLEKQSNRKFEDFRSRSASLLTNPCSRVLVFRRNLPFHISQHFYKSAPLQFVMTAQLKSEMGNEAKKHSQ